MRKILKISGVIFLLLFIIYYFNFRDPYKIKYKNNQTTEIERNNDEISYFIYFTGIGCPHCAKVDPVLFKNKIINSNILVIEYEIYRERINASLLMEYNNKYKTGLGIPLLIFGEKKKDFLIGDKTILKSLNNIILNNQNNKILTTKKSISFKDLNISDLKGLPKIWYNDRVAIKINLNSTENQSVKDFLINNKIPTEAKDFDSNKINLSDNKVNFANSKKYNGWIFYYNKNN